MTSAFSLTRNLFGHLQARSMLGRLPAGLADDNQSGQLDWHIRNAALAHSGTAQLVSYNALVEFIAMRYAALLGTPLGDDVYQLAQRAINGCLPKLRQASSPPELQRAYDELVGRIDDFLGSATMRNASPDRADTAHAQRQAIAAAIWQQRPPAEGEADQNLADLPRDHPVWAQADAVLALLSGALFATPAVVDAEDARRYRWIRADHLRHDKQDCWQPRISVAHHGGTLTRYVQDEQEHDLSVDRAMAREPQPA